MLYISRRMPAGELKATKAGRIWTWSDLYSGRTETISSFARPSRVHSRWTTHRSAVGTARSAGDTIICLGDIAIHGLSGTPAQAAARRAGRKIVVIGNHEISPVGEVDIDGFDEIDSTLYVAWEPPPCC